MCVPYGHQNVESIRLQTIEDTTSKLELVVLRSVIHLKQESVSNYSVFMRHSAPPALMTCRDLIAYSRLPGGLMLAASVQAFSIY